MRMKYKSNHNEAEEYHAEMPRSLVPCRFSAAFGKLKEN
jgi:hypothetical protein